MFKVRFVFQCLLQRLGVVAGEPEDDFIHLFFSTALFL